MTKRQALQAALVGITIPDSSLDLQMINAGIIPEANYDKSHAEELGRMEFEILNWILAMPDVSEGDQSIRYDRKAVQTRLTYLSNKFGIVSNTVPTVRGRSDVW